jgi:hypothetical protein
MRIGRSGRRRLGRGRGASCQRILRVVPGRCLACLPGRPAFETRSGRRIALLALGSIVCLGARLPPWRKSVLCLRPATPARRHSRADVSPPARKPGPPGGDTTPTVSWADFVGAETRSEFGTNSTDVRRHLAQRSCGGIAWPSRFAVDGDGSTAEPGGPPLASRLRRPLRVPSSYGEERSPDPSCWVHARCAHGPDSCPGSWDLVPLCSRSRGHGDTGDVDRAETTGGRLKRFHGRRVIGLVPRMTIDWAIRRHHPRRCRVARNVGGHHLTGESAVSSSP